jgi:hypothetical protein
MPVEDYTIAKLQIARTQLLAIPKTNLTHDAITKWYCERECNNALTSAETAGNLLRSILHIVQGLDDAPPDVLEEVRNRVIERMDVSIARLDAKRPVRPVLADRIIRIKDVKLTALLTELNNNREQAPNLSAISFRTILSLVISERAKLAAPGSRLATKQDLEWEADIKTAIAAKIFDDANTRRLESYLRRLTKDTMDIVAHKTGSNALVDKHDLSAAVDLLNNLLAEIT